MSCLTSTAYQALGTGQKEKVELKLVCEVVEPYMPKREDFEPGILYISKEYELAIHLCPCGCGGQAVTPTGNGGWTLQFDGEIATLSPSLLNNFCGSHYYIRNNEVIWT